MSYPETPDGRYFVAKGRLWRKTNPALPDDERRAHIKALMKARRAVHLATNDDEVREARAQVDRAKRALGERGSVWWTDGAPDDLKKIKGVGPVFERELNDKGIYYYRQIGAWKAADIKTIEADAMSRYPGRIKRDGWVKQAKALAKGVKR